MTLTNESRDSTMNNLEYTALSKDTRTICQIVINADYQCSQTVGRYGVTKVSVFDEHGEMAHVPWFEVWKGNALYARVNARFVSEVLYQEGQPAPKESAQ